MPGAPQGLDSIALPLPVDDRNPAIFRAVEQPGALRMPRVTPLSPQLLSNILWSTWGANRRAARNTGHEIEIFLIHDRSAYQYVARSNHLQPLAGVDDGVECPAGSASANTTAETVQLIYVANLPQTSAGMEAAARRLPEPQMQGGYYCADTGALAGKVYLFASAHGISAVPQPCDHARLALRLDLRADQQVLFMQSIRCPGGSGRMRAA